MATPPVDLKKVGELFDATLAAIRDSTPDNATLEPHAVVWLKAARYKVMRQIEASYYELERSRDQPFQRPCWVDPSQYLLAVTDPVPIVLMGYWNLFRLNILELMKACGFNSSSIGAGVSNELLLTIYFPEVPRVAQHPAMLPDRLDVEDEFSRTGEGGGQFSGTAFGRLLVGARADGDAGEDGTAESKSPAVKDESDDDQCSRLQ